MPLLTLDRMADLLDAADGLAATDREFSRQGLAAMLREVVSAYQRSESMRTLALAALRSPGPRAERVERARKALEAW